jgi:hypothetical protein
MKRPTELMLMGMPKFPALSAEHNRLELLMR